MSRERSRPMCAHCNRNHNEDVACPRRVALFLTGNLVTLTDADHNIINQFKASGRTLASVIEDWFVRRSNSNV